MNEFEEYEVLVPVAGLRFLDETGQALVAGQMRAVLEQQYSETPALRRLRPRRLVLVPTAPVLQPDQPSHHYAVELETVPSVELTHFDSYRVLVGLLEIDRLFEETHGRRKELNATLS